MIVNPDYQRNFVYNPEKTSKLIESALMGIPLPSIYLCEEEDGRLSVIDGQQRLKTLIDFTENKFSLNKKINSEDWKNKKYTELNLEDQKTIDETNLYAYTLIKGQDKLKFDIFERLNKGAVNLNEQELRNCVYHGQYNKMINELSKEDVVQKLFKFKNTRMKYQEFILRFLALSDSKEYNGYMKQFLNEHMDHHIDAIKNIENKTKKDKNKFLNISKLVLEALGEYAFCKIGSIGEIKRNSFNIGYYESIMIAFSNFDEQSIRDNYDEISKEIDSLKRENKTYKSTMKSSTTSKDNVMKRIGLVTKSLKKIVGENKNKIQPRSFPSDWKPKLAKDQDYKCGICRQEMRNIDIAEIDHIIPYSKGGETTRENAQLVHEKCNRSKSNK
ncbi:HNH endonuclease family protein [Mycoplasma sp. 4463]|uniref:HNH endonuclease family protein n=1 Tax=Mycoplasma sp. 4463 TaxID=3400998 RepID=UPI003AB0607A